MKSTKLLLLLFSTILFCWQKAICQPTSKYDAAWKNIDQLIQKKNLPKSALEEVKKIYALAKAEHNNAQIIKSLVYMISLQQENTENSEQKAIEQMEKEITINQEPASSILKSLLASYYWQYFQRHRYELYDRTNTVQFQKNDPATWTLDDFHRKISDLYLQSIKKDQVLKQTSLEAFEPILRKGNVRYLRPTLYDLLAHQALSYFKNDERDITKPAYAFEINQVQAFAPALEFVRYPFSTKDSLSLQQKALKIYQDLIAFHLGDAKPDALVDVDIERINYAYDHAVMDNKDSLYENALKQLTAKYPSSPVVSQAWYFLAEHYTNRGSEYEPLKDSTHRWDKIKARDILVKVVQDSTVKNEGWTNSYNLLQELTQPSFSFKTEVVNIPGQPFRILVKYKNLSSLHFRLIKANEAIQDIARSYDERFWNSLIQASTVKQWHQSLPATNDLQEHLVEVKADAVPVGEYYLLASADKQFSTGQNPLGAQLFYVSNISYVNKGNQYFVLNRESGQPLANALVQLYHQEYDSKTSKNIKRKVSDYQTDQHGYFKAAIRNTDYYNYFLNIRHQSDHLFLNEPSTGYYSNSPFFEQRSPSSIFFFTDRSIYRPGQTVFFKAIVVNNHQQQHTVATGYTTTLYLVNANQEPVDSLTLTTNEFGSLSGKFQLPQTVLTGEFTIRAKDVNEYTQEAHFSVEEYKRPKFHVDFEPVMKSYKVNDTITLTGNALAYAGNKIDGAKVSYRVIRRPRFIYLWLTWKWLPPAQPMEIAHGETTTDKEGKFTIQFAALPDRKIDPKSDPVFDYQIYADVTDINGETRSGEHRITAGYKSLILKADLAERISVDSLKSIRVRTENVNGAFQPSTVTINIYRLQPEQRLIRKRYWEQPDQFVMSKQEFISYFPHDEYDNETDFMTWPVENKAYTKTDTSSSQSLFILGDHQLTPGYYKWELITHDQNGKEVKEVKYTELYNPGSKTFTRPEYLWAKGSDHPIEPGEQTNIQLGSSAQDVFVINNVDKLQDSTDSFSFLTWNNQKTSYPFKATEADRGGYGINYFFVKDNRFYQFEDIVQVPWSNKQLNIEYATFREKTLPGSEERWKVKITGNQKDKAAAEMLASMYDASLDQFREHKWEVPKVWDVYLNPNSWNERGNFKAIEAVTKESERNFREFLKTYDELIFGQPRYQIKYKGIRAMAMNRNDNEDKLEEARQDVMAGYAPGAIIETNKFTPPVIKSDSEEVSNALNKKPQLANSNIQIRKNFNETAFFFPDLHTNENGDIEFSFTVPEALTQWKIQTLAHTKDLALGLSQKEMVSQKQLMVQPNPPRFLRQGDHMEFTVKVVNLSDSEITGQAQLELLDATTNQSVDGWFMNTFPNQYFTVAAGQSEVVKFPLQVPFQFNKALVWRVVARAGNLSDGEENAMPVLSNKVLVTETLPLPVRGTGTKNFTFEKLLQSGNSETLQNQSLTVEYTSNPAWYAVQALPYLMEFPYECSEQIWNRYYANTLAGHMVHSSPRIREVFEKWKNADTAALLSNLQKNQELKSVLLEETPWVLEARSEEQQKKNIALLFDLIRMNNEAKTNLEKLRQMQSENGGFVWFTGGPDDRYITQYIVTGIGRLKKLGLPVTDLKPILATALPYLDKKIKEDYDDLVKHKADLSKPQISATGIFYLYLRSFFPEYPVAPASQKAYAYFKRQSQTFWMKQNKYLQGMTALALYRTGDQQTPAAIIRSLKETAINNEETGMYWKDNSFGYNWRWWYAPIETQSLLIEAFSEAAKDTKTVDDLKTWLIKNKQTNNWYTTKATADACYALLSQGTNWLAQSPNVQISLGNLQLHSSEEKTEAGTGYFRQTIPSTSVQPQMGNITVQVQASAATPVSQPTNLPSWGSVYWQYFEDMDKISAASSPLKLSKKLFIETTSDRGPVLTPIGQGTELHVGDKIKVRIELRTDRDMEYVHMKDLRASAFEPVNVISSYKWQGRLGYYESTRDASTNFFFSYLPKGTHVFEYPLFVTHTGNFSTGLTTIQCMYAPEFSAHSEGERSLNIE